MPTTTPVDDTCAMSGALELQVITRPVNTSFCASRVVAVSRALPPTVTVTGLGPTLTLATGIAVTVTAATALFPSTDAVITAGPGEMPVTSPVASTVATLGALEDQVNFFPVSGCPCASSAVAVSLAVVRTWIDVVSGETDTEAAVFASTVTFASAYFPSELAAICTLPGATPVTTPSSDTVAMALSLLAQNTWRSDSGFPWASRTVACSGVDAPTLTLAVVGETSTLATLAPCGPDESLHPGETTIAAAAAMRNVR
jgi:hypothetical protein